MADYRYQPDEPPREQLFAVGFISVPVTIDDLQIKMASRMVLKCALYTFMLQLFLFVVALILAGATGSIGVLAGTFVINAITLTINGLIFYLAVIGVQRPTDFCCANCCTYLGVYQIVVAILVALTGLNLILSLVAVAAGFFVSIFTLLLAIIFLVLYCYSYYYVTKLMDLLRVYYANHGQQYEPGVGTVTFAAATVSQPSSHPPPVVRRPHFHMPITSCCFASAFACCFFIF